MGGRKILITGAAGFIGSHTAELLLRRDDQVIGIDNFNSYYDIAQKRANVGVLREFSNFTLVEDDIRNRDCVDEIFKSHSFDAVIHLAAMAGVRASVEAPHHYFDVNVTGTLNLLEAAKTFGQPNFVCASTSSAYGRTKTLPFIETDSADRPLAPYPASKRCCELLGHSYHHAHGMNFTALRFFTVYGPRNRPDMLPMIAMRSFREDGKLVMYNDGEMYRDWTYVGDIADGIVRAADRPLGFEVINLGRGEPVLLRKFVESLAQLSGVTPTWDSRPMPSADVEYTFANIDKARALLGYSPRVSVEDGLPLFLEWYERFRSSYRKI